MFDVKKVHVGRTYKKCEFQVKPIKYPMSVKLQDMDVRGSVTINFVTERIEVFFTEGERILVAQAISNPYVKTKIFQEIFCRICARSSEPIWNFDLTYDHIQTGKSLLAHIVETDLSFIENKLLYAIVDGYKQITSASKDISEKTLLKMSNLSHKDKLKAYKILRGYLKSIGNKGQSGIRIMKEWIAYVSE